MAFALYKYINLYTLSKIDKKRKYLVRRPMPKKQLKKYNTTNAPAQSAEVLLERRLVRLYPLQHGLVVLPVRAKCLTPPQKTRMRHR